MIQPEKNPLILAIIYVCIYDFFIDKIETFMNKDLGIGLRITF